MGGIVGILAFDKIWNISKFLKYSLMGLQHRGYSNTSVAILNEKIVKSDSNSAPEDLEINSEGWAGIGYTGSRGCKLQIFDEIALAIDGITKESPEQIAKIVLKDPENLKNVKGAFSMIALSKEGEIIAYRDESGLKPLALGGFGFDLGIISSEMTGITVIGGDFRREVKPGELIIMNKYNIETKQLIEPKESYCSIEYIYQSRIDSYVNGKYIYDLRVKIGEELAEERKIDADTVIGVPDTALPFALGYSRKTGIPMNFGFTRTGSPIRTMLASDDFLKIVGVQLKLNPIKSAVFGKRVILIDDSMVTGTTLKNTVYNLRRLGAKEVHVLIGSPKLISYCPYEVEVPPSSELIAANLSDEEVSKVIGADSIYWLSLEGLYKVIGNNKLCVGCMLGKYPKVI
ncbi:amidophosphoribosyltransferase [Acidianus sulfidivorans JP7]|uniref:Amidophosphoribosyltransferase n=1 Tax=Acidianus sulfidivorans JP7 TaxID=619593 RepID=A0A2U9INI2_9CREN|nr:amidophosphoribosyltransferase [Acidianus sulfidivorans]AWR97556.1 amidophosphoribosyltransferase [Acidianus sulfidivorans JP7]